MPRIIDINQATGEVFITEIPDPVEELDNAELVVEEVTPPIE